MPLAIALPPMSYAQDIVALGEIERACADKSLFLWLWRTPHQSVRSDRQFVTVSVVVLCTPSRRQRWCSAEIK